MTNVVKKIRALSEDEKNIIKRAFEYLDTDKDGYLDYHETKAAMRALGFEVKKSQLLAIMKACDKNEGNTIDYKDFYYIMADKIAKRNPIDEIKNAYKLFVSESLCGKITFVDLQRINKSLECRFSDEEMHAMIDEFDADQDGCSVHIHSDDLGFLEFGLAKVQTYHNVKMNFGVNWDEENRRTLLAEREALERSSQSVVRSQRVAAETEQIGREVITELGGQRETLLRAKTRLSETDQELDTSRKIMRMINKRVLTNKIVLILIIVLEMAILGLTVYLKYFNHK